MQDIWKKIYYLPTRNLFVLFLSVYVYKNIILQLFIKQCTFIFIYLKHNFTVIF